jgi:hypothetical protein
LNEANLIRIRRVELRIHFKEPKVGQLRLDCDDTSSSNEGQRSKDSNMSPEVQPSVACRDFKVENGPFVDSSHYHLIDNFFITETTSKVQTFTGKRRMAKTIQEIEHSET